MGSTTLHSKIYIMLSDKQNYRSLCRSTLNSFLSFDAAHTELAIETSPNFTRGNTYWWQICVFRTHCHLSSFTHKAKMTNLKDVLLNTFPTKNLFTVNRWFSLIVGLMMSVASGTQYMFGVYVTQRGDITTH